MIHFVLRLLVGEVRAKQGVQQVRQQFEQGRHATAGIQVVPGKPLRRARRHVS